jgi:integrase
MGSGSGSPANQSHRLFEHANRIGQSRHKAKLNGTARSKFFNPATLDDYKKNFTRVLVFARQHSGLHRAADLSPTITAAFIRSLHERGYAPTTIDKYEAVINKADAAMRECGWKAKDAPPLLPNEPRAPKEQPDPVPFTSLEADRVLAQLAELRDPCFWQMGILQRHAGLRVREAVMLRAEAISEEGDRLRLERGDGTKGGRPREVIVFNPVAQELLRDLRATALKRGKRRVFVESDSEKRIKALIRAHQRALQLVTQELAIDHSKTHDLRRTFANEVLLKLCQMGLTQSEAGRTLSKFLGHGESRMAKGLLASYIALDKLDNFRPAG